MSGLKLACQAGPYDTRGLLKTAVRAAALIFLEHKLHVAQLRGLVDELVHRAVQEVGVLHVGDRPQPANRLQIKSWKECR